MKYKADCRWNFLKTKNSSEFMQTKTLHWANTLCGLPEYVLIIKQDVNCKC